MRILAINGCMRKTGSTYKMLETVLERMKREGDADIEVIHVADLNLPFCVSCHNCFVKGEEYCPHAETVGKVVEALRRADGVILAGTTYVMALNAAMKNLVDHIAWMNHRPALFGKHGLVIATTAGGGAGGVAKYLREVMGYWGICGAGTLVNNKAYEPFPLTDKQLAKIHRAADRFAGAVRSGRAPKPAMENIGSYNAFRAMSLSKTPLSEKDAEFWRASGFRDKAYPSGGNPIQLFIGEYMIFRQTKRAFDKYVKPVRY